MALRVATFNLKDFFAPRAEAERATVEAKVSNVARDLRRANADVVALQEVGSTELLDRLFGKELADLGYSAPVVGTEDKRGIRNVIASRLPVQWSQVHAPRTLPFPRFYETDPEPFTTRIPLRRGVVHVRVDAGSLGEVDVITAHFKSNLGVPLRDAAGEEIEDPTPRGRGEAALRSLVQRGAEALFVRGIVDDLVKTKPDHAVVVLGDLNDGPESLPVRIVRGIGEPSSAFLRATSDLVAQDRRFSSFHGGAPCLIDHVLVSERLFRCVREAAYYNESLRYHGPYAENEGLTPDSDHALGLVAFESDG
jgi:endonuclease/exonuclease/phosphatase family metal-dependent hydrolase